MRCCSRSRPPAPAASPRVTSGRPNCAASLATTRSHASHKLEPPASALPLDRGDHGLSGGPLGDAAEPAAGPSGCRRPGTPSGPSRRRTYRPAGQDDEPGRPYGSPGRSSAAAMPARDRAVDGVPRLGTVDGDEATPSFTSVRTSSATSALPSVGCPASSRGYFAWKPACRHRKSWSDSRASCSRSRSVGPRKQVGELGLRSRAAWGTATGAMSLTFELLAGFAGPVEWRVSMMPGAMVLTRAPIAARSRAAGTVIR